MSMCPLIVYFLSDYEKVIVIGMVLKFYCPGLSNYVENNVCLLIVHNHTRTCRVNSQLSSCFDYKENASLNVIHTYTILFWPFN